MGFSVGFFPTFSGPPVSTLGVPWRDKETDGSTWTLRHLQGRLQIFLRLETVGPWFLSSKIWGWVKTLVPSEPQNSW
jgi:hypothetical protein